MAKEMQTVVELLKNIYDVLSTKVSFTNNDNLRFFLPKLDSVEGSVYYNFTLQKHNSYTFVKSIEKTVDFANSVLISKEIEIKQFSIVDYSEFRDSEIFSLLGYIPRDKGFLTILQQLKQNKQNANMLISLTELEEQDIKKIEMILIQLKKTGLISGFSLDKRQKTLELSQKDRLFFSGKWFELSSLFEISKCFLEPVIIRSLKYRKGLHEGEIDICILYDNDIMFVETKSANNIELVKKGLVQLHRNSKIFDVPLKSCFLVTFNGYNDQVFQEELDKLKEEYSNVVNIIEFHEIKSKLCKYVSEQKNINLLGDNSLFINDKSTNNNYDNICQANNSKTL